MNAVNKLWLFRKIYKDLYGGSILITESLFDFNGREKLDLKDLIVNVNDCLKDTSHPSDNSDLFLLLFLCSSLQHSNVRLGRKGQKREQLVNDSQWKMLLFGLEEKHSPR